MPETIEAKISAYRSSIKSSLVSPKKSKKILHLQCDFIEYLALISSRPVEIDDIESFFYGPQEDTEEESGDEHEAERDEEDETHIVNLFQVLRYRQLLFGDGYPFDIDEDTISLSSTLSNKKKLYIILLMCSNLNILGTFQHHLTKEFEKITDYALQNIFPDTQVKKMGEYSDYAGNNTINKIRLLADDLNLQVDEDALLDIEDQNSKEEGLDLIVWNKFGDNKANTLILLVQCACGKGILPKTAEPERYLDFIHFKFITPITTLAIPYSLFTSDNRLEERKNIRKSLLYERSRLINAINDMSFLNALETYKLVTAFQSPAYKINILD